MHAAVAKWKKPAIRIGNTRLPWGDAEAEAELAVLSGASWRRGF